MEDLTRRANRYADGLRVNIYGNGFTNRFVICGDSQPTVDTEWAVDTKENLLILNTISSTEFIDTNVITRVQFNP